MASWEEHELLKSQSLWPVAHILLKGYLLIPSKQFQQLGAVIQIYGPGWDGGFDCSILLQTTTVSIVK